MSRVTDPRCHVEYIYTYIEYGRRKAFLFVDKLTTVGGQLLGQS